MRILAVFLMVGTGRLWAANIQTPPKSNKVIYGWCGKEIYDFCRNAQTMPERLRCLEKHKSRLSADCRSKVAAAHNEAAKLLHGCSRDLSKYCADRMSGYGPASQCLLDHRKNLSVPCRSQMAEIEHYAYRTLVWNSCKPQILSLCYQETTEKGVSACLRKNLDQLPFGCRQAGLKAGLWAKTSLADENARKARSPRQAIQALEP